MGFIVLCRLKHTGTVPNRIGGARPEMAGHRYRFHRKQCFASLQYLLHMIFTRNNLLHHCKVYPRVDKRLADVTALSVSSVQRKDMDHFPQFGHKV